MTRKTYKKIIVTNELLEKINIKNKKLVEAFLKEKNTRASDTTIEAYRSDLNIFFCWNAEQNSNKEFTEIRKLEFADFFSFATSELQWKSARFGRCRATLSSFSQFIEKFYDDEYPNFRNMILKVVENMPKDAAREKTVLSEEDILKLLAHLEEKDIQQAMWLALAVASGARFSELFRFDLDVIDLNKTAYDGIFLETSKQIKTKGRTKTGKMLYKYIIKDIFLPYYEKWIPKRKEIMEANGVEEHNKLFIRLDGSPAVVGTVRSWINGMDRFMDKPLYAHSLRHYVVTYLSKKGIPQQLIKDLMGWSSVNMVEIYNDLTSKDIEWKELQKLKVKY